MKLPRIYSLSTVGILKHYNQDYLIHPVRTDFTGSNGVGKSIIADIIQLIFISNNQLIQFGTDGLNNELRQPYTLPLHASEAYAFLNIEFKKDDFITIGVCIPNKRSRPIKPFIVLSDGDMDKHIDDLVYPKARLLRSRDFIKNDRFLTIDELGKHLMETKGLTLKYFAQREGKNQYYSFLFNNNILPINLCIKDNLNSFAKIIQSFSRARSLNVNNSKSLKKFLLEDSGKKYEIEFKQHKASLEKLIKEFDDTEDYIKDLKKKQNRLKSLKLKEEIKEMSKRKALEAELVFSLREKMAAEKGFKKSQKELTDEEMEEKSIRKKLPDLEKSKNKIGKQIGQLKNSIEHLKKYQQCYFKYRELTAQKNEIEKVAPPIIKEKTNGVIDIDDFDNREIIRRIREFKPVYLQYGSLYDMEKQVDAQRISIEQEKIALKQSISQINDSLKLVRLNEKDTLFSKILSSGQPLSKSQESVLFHYLKMKWDKPPHAKAGDQYTDNMEVLDEKNIVADEANGGVWFAMGDVREFVPYKKEDLLFNAPNNIKQALVEKENELLAELEKLKNKLQLLNDFERGESIKNNSARLSFELDERLHDYSRLREFEKTACIIQNLNKRISSIDSKVDELNLKLNSYQENVNFEINGGSLDNDLKRTENTLEALEGTYNSLLLQIAEYRSALNLLATKVIPSKKEYVEEKKWAFRKKEIDFTEKELSAKREYPDLVINSIAGQKISQKELGELKELRSSSREDYITEFKKILEEFEETKNGNNIELANEVNNNSYSFSLFEKILLGKIKHVDNVGGKLSEANKTRVSIIDSIHETMLKIFIHTKHKYEEYKGMVRDLNSFFKGKKISNRYFFQINFESHPDFSVDWINHLQSQSQSVYSRGELPFGSSVEEFVEVFFQKISNYEKRISFSDLLDPKTYFELSVSLTDENKNEIPGSTGETYSAIVLLGIGRLSIVQSDKRDGIRFIILEETANLDMTNFNTFPAIAKEFGYQIITMTPKPYGSDAEEGWYLHHLLPGADNKDINYPVPCSYFKTNENSEDLELYLEAMEVV